MLLVVVFFVVFCSSTTIFSQSSMFMYGCRELRNVTFLGPFPFDYRLIVEELGPCTKSYLYDFYTKKIIPADNEAMDVNPFGNIQENDILYAVQTILDDGNSASDNYRQTLVFLSSSLVFKSMDTRHSVRLPSYKRNLFHKYLGKIQNEKGWDIIICDPSHPLSDVNVSWIPVNLFFPLPTTKFNLVKYLPMLINNPRFDVIKWYKTITPDNFDNSCLPSKDGEAVVNIFFDMLETIIPSVLVIIQNIIAIMSHFPSNKDIKFVLHMSITFKETKFFDTYIKSYNVKEKSISFNFFYTSFPPNSIDLIESDSKATNKRNFYMIISRLSHFYLKLMTDVQHLRDFCSHEKFLRLYLYSIDGEHMIHYHSEISRECKGKLDGTINIFNHEHFFLFILEQLLLLIH